MCGAGAVDQGFPIREHRFRKDITGLLYAPRHSEINFFDFLSERENVMSMLFTMTPKNSTIYVGERADFFKFIVSPRW